jgi:hypothetical protein
MNARSIWSSCFVVCFAAIAGAQTAPPSAPNPKTVPAEMGAYGWGARMGLACAAGASAAAEMMKPTAQCGALISSAIYEFEIGVMGPQARQSSVSGYLSANVWAPLIAPSKLGNMHGVPLVVGGYTRMFETGHALDYGVAIARPIDAAHSVQFEVRDYWELSNAHQHNVVFRVVWLVGVPD